ncbi:alpha-ribazole phosphatase family protein [Rhodoblastus sp.]|uniref:alpha-ribazole phosphatase family protein n=1 Tax=Rhodoblastus sp. TaxID=1962975 RepID=UPI003F961F3A
MLRLFLIRHPKPAVAPGLCYGRSDIGLERPAEEDAARLRRLLPENVPLFSSPLRRCRLLAEALRPAPRFDDRLREMDFGDWELQPWDGIDRDLLDAWARNPLDFTPPGGESARNLRARVAEFCEELKKQDRQEAVLLAHGGVLRAAVSALTGAPNWLTLTFDFGAVSLVENGALRWTNRR